MQIGLEIFCTALSCSTWSFVGKSQTHLQNCPLVIDWQALWEHNHLIIQGLLLVDVRE